MSSDSPSILSEALSEAEESDPEFELVGETDADRREALFASDQNAEEASNKLGPSNSWKALEQEFDFNNHGQGSSSSSKVSIDSIFDISSNDDDDNFPVASGSTFTHEHNAAKDKGKYSPSDEIKESTSSRARHSNPNLIALGRMVEAEMDLRKKESLGMAPVKGRRQILGSRSTGMTQNSAQSTSTKWNCLVCTLSVALFCNISLGFVLIPPSENQLGHLSCSACSTPRGEQTWSQRPLQ